MERILEYTIKAEDQGLPVDRYLKKQDFSHAILTILRHHWGSLLQNGVPVTTRAALSSGDLLRVILPETEVSDIQPFPVRFNLIYEDQDLLVVSKYPDTPVHPSFGNHENTLANGLAYYFHQKGESFVFRCINRLDRDTSGLLILAKNILSASILSKDMRNRNIHRTYRALIHGKLPASGTIDLPIGRKPGSLVERMVDSENGQQAVTYFKLLKYDSVRDISLAELHLGTGRTHQIRVHMAAAGHPLLGDTLYNPRANDPVARQALHSYALDFQHPIRKEAMHFTAPLPDDLLI